MEPAPAPTRSLWSSLTPLSLCCQHSIQRVLLEAEPGNVTSLHQTSQGLDSQLPSEQTPRSWWCSMRLFLTLWPLQPLSCSSHVVPLGLWDTPLSGTFFPVCVHSIVPHLPWSLCADDVLWLPFMPAASCLCSPRSPGSSSHVTSVFFLSSLGRGAAPGQGLHLFSSLMDLRPDTTGQAVGTQQLCASCIDRITGRDAVD